MDSPRLCLEWDLGLQREKSAKARTVLEVTIGFASGEVLKTAFSYGQEVPKARKTQQRGLDFTFGFSKDGSAVMLLSQWVSRIRVWAIIE